MNSIECIVCFNPIASEELALCIQSGINVCYNCRQCEKCQNHVSTAELKLSIRDSKSPIHARCEAAGRFKNTIPVHLISQSDLDFLNAARLILCPDVEDLSPQTNVNRALMGHSQLWSGMAIEQKLTHVQMMEAVYGQSFMLMKKDPSEIKAKSLEADRERVTNARTKADAGTIENVRIAKEIKKVEKAKASAQEKFVIDMAKLGLELSMIKSIWISKGKVWTE